MYKRVRMALRFIASPPVMESDLTLTSEQLGDISQSCRNVVGQQAVGKAVGPIAVSHARDVHAAAAVLAEKILDGDDGIAGR